MCRRIRGIICLALAMMMVIPTLVIPAYASVKQDVPESIALYTVTGIDVAEHVKTSMRSAGLTVTDESVIQVVSVCLNTKSNNGGNALIVTNTDGTKVTKEALICVGENGVFSYLDNDGKLSSDVYEHDFEQAEYIVYAYAVYDVYYLDYGGSGTYYRPLSASFLYNYRTTCTIESIEETYTIAGREYEYPSYDPVDSDWPDMEHIISFEVANPKMGYLYTSDPSDAFSQDRVILLSGPVCGQQLDVTVTVNGRVDEMWFQFM